MLIQNYYIYNIVESVYDAAQKVLSSDEKQTNKWDKKCQEVNIYLLTRKFLENVNKKT